VKHVNHETSKTILHAAIAAGIARITMEDLTHIRARIKAGKRVRGRLHRWLSANCKPLSSTRPVRQELRSIPQPRLYQPDVFGVWRHWQTRQASFRVFVWSPGARRLECKSKPCPDWQDCCLAKGDVNTRYAGNVAGSIHVSQ
jgi:hypothetical protein